MAQSRIPCFIRRRALLSRGILVSPDTSSELMTSSYWESKRESSTLMVDLLPKTDPDDKHLFDLFEKGIHRRQVLDVLSDHSRGTGRAAKSSPSSLQIVSVRRVLERSRRSVERTRCLDFARTSDAERASTSEPPTSSHRSSGFGRWAQNLSRLAEQRAELRWQEGRQTGKEEGRAEGFPSTG